MWKKWCAGILCAAMLITGTGFSVKAAGKPDVSAKSAILIEAGTGRVLFEKNAHEQRPMASTTKIMSALLTLESGELDRQFTVDPEAIMVEGSSMGLQKGDTVTKRILAYGMLLPSGNDAANAAAVAVGGTAKEFVSMMNRRAQMLGLKNTSFETPSGLDGKNHYSTAADMATLARAALKNPDFRDICGKSTAKVEFGNPPYTRWLSNHNRLLKEYQGTIGLKTGFTKKAGRCLVSAAERDGVTLICVTLNAPNDWQDHKKLFDFGFGQVKPIQLDVQTDDLQLTVVGGQQSKVGVLPGEYPTACITEADQSKLVRRVLIKPFDYAPVEAGSVVGEVQYLLNGEVIASTALLAQNDVAQKITPIKVTFWDKVKRFFKNIYYSIVGFIQKIMD